MSRPMKTRRIGLLASLAVLLVGFLGCSADTPTAPDQVPAPPPTQGGDNWNISVSVSPDVLDAGAAEGEGGTIEPAIVSVTIKSRFDGSSPPNGTTMVVETTLGELGAEGSGATSVGVLIDRGKASVFLFPGNIIAFGTVTARLEGSSARDNFEVVGSSEAFITAVRPNSGSESGGTHVTIEGTGFVEPLLVNIGAYPATVTSVSETAIRVVTPPASGPLTFIACGDGGKEYQPTPFPVSVTLQGETAITLANGFFYTPDNTGCIGGG